MDTADIVKLVSLLSVLAVYFVPTIMAIHHKHPRKTIIILINVLLGWTLVGWIVALVWSHSNQKKEKPAPKS